MASATEDPRTLCAVLAVAATASSLLSVWLVPPQFWWLMAISPLVILLVMMRLAKVQGRWELEDELLGTMIISVVVAIAFRSLFQGW